MKIIDDKNLKKMIEDLDCFMKYLDDSEEIGIIDDSYNKIKKIYKVKRFTFKIPKGTSIDDNVINLEDDLLFYEVEVDYGNDNYDTLITTLDKNKCLNLGHNIQYF